MTTRNAARAPVAIREGSVRSADGTLIRYTVHGDGVPMVLCNGIGCSTLYFNYIVEYFQQTMQVITWDYKGHGKSGDPETYDHLTIADCADDLGRVLDGAGVDRAILAGHSMGVQVVFEAYRQFPERISGLIPILGTFERPFDTMLNSEIPRYIFPFAYLLGTTFPKPMKLLGELIYDSPLAAPVARFLALNPLLTPEHDMKAYFHHLASLDPKLFFTLALDMQKHTARDVLPKITVPTLILAGTKDDFTPAWKSEEMHRLIPGSEIMLIKTGSHVGLIEQPALVNLRLEKFLVEHFGVPRPPAPELA
ncbi:MAG: alpha/beta hydrolase [Myxococcales bacterium]|nr:alpha/beta hydrolase [Myxococcales bacterium]